MIKRNPLKDFVREDLPGRFNEVEMFKRHRDRIFLQDSGEVLPPYEVLIHPSSACNLRCAWCIGDHVPIKSKDGNLINIIDASKSASETLPNLLADTDAMTKMMHSMLEYKKEYVVNVDGESVGREFRIENISFSGLIGEPLSSKASVLEAMKLAVAADRRVGIFTNGVLMNEAVRDVFVNINYVHFSLDSATPETYAWLKFGDVEKGKSRFHDAIRNLSALSDARGNQANCPLELNASFILYPENFHELYDAARLLKDIGVDSLRVKHDNSGSKPLNSHQISQCVEMISRIREELEDDSFRFIQIHVFDEKLDFTRQFSKCRITDLMAAVGSDGNMYPCNYHPRPNGTVYGNVVDRPFSEIWEGEQRAQLRKCIPEVCPKVCDPFKTRTNRLLEQAENLAKEMGYPKVFDFADNLEIR